jgi:cellulose synthase/poly-beta-1,6-N-acetylglucosamine synthase-like glycosyltransferase
MPGMVDAYAAAEIVILLTGLLFALSAIYSVFFILVGTLKRAGGEDRPIRAYPAITAVIAAKDEPVVLPHTLARLLELPYPTDKFTVIVALDEGDNATAAACLPYAGRVRVVFTHSHKGKPGVLNKVLPLVEGELMFLLDADSMPDRDALNQMLPLILDDGFIATSAQGYPLNTGEGIFPRFFRLECRIQADLNANKAKAGFFAYTPGFCTLIRTSEVRRIGGWDEECLSEDSDLAFRLWATGSRISESPARVGMEAPARLSRFCRQRLRWYRGMLDAYRKDRSLLYGVPFAKSIDVTMQFLSPVFVSLFIPFFLGALIMGGPPLFLLGCLFLILVGGVLIIRGSFSYAERVENAVLVVPFLLLNSAICIFAVITFLLNRKIAWKRTEKSNFFAGKT